MNFFRHFLTPYQTNNYKAKILHTFPLLLIILTLISFSASIVLFKDSHPEVLGISYSITDQELLDDTNKARVQNNVPPLALNEKLSNAARAKASFMIEKNFWAHFAPDGTTPWSFIKSSGYDYAFAGENLAKGFTNSQDVVDAWMNSPSHRENLLSTKYTDIGFATQEGTLTGEDTVLVVQMFGAPYVAAAVEPESDKQISPPAQKIASEEKSAPVQIPQQAVRSQGTQALVNVPTATKSISVVFLFFIITILLLDLMIVEKRKIPRIVGHNLDHVIILVLLLVFILLERSGGIL